MNIKAMLEAQKRLDQANFDKAGITEYPLEEVKIAYRVELGEALQEAKFWKYWKKSKGEVDREKLLEELADCLHFALSLEMYYQGDYYESNQYDITIRDATKYDIFKIVNCCFESDYNNEMYFILENTTALGLKLGFTLKELEQAYWDKNKINWNRVNSDY